MVTPGSLIRCFEDALPAMPGMSLIWSFFPTVFPGAIPGIASMASFFFAGFAGAIPGIFSIFDSGVAFVGFAGETIPGIASISFWPRDVGLGVGVVFGTRGDDFGTAFEGSTGMAIPPISFVLDEFPSFLAFAGRDSTFGGAGVGVGVEIGAIPGIPSIAC